MNHSRNGLVYLKIGMYSHPLPTHSKSASAAEAPLKNFEVLNDCQRSIDNMPGQCRKNHRKFCK